MTEAATIEIVWGVDSSTNPVAPTAPPRAMSNRKFWVSCP
jgi:hypothetical protein